MGDTYITVTGTEGRRYERVEDARKDWDAGLEFRVVCIARTGSCKGNVSKWDFSNEVSVSIALDGPWAGVELLSRGGRDD